MSFHPTPARIFEEFEAGSINREQLHAALAWHHRRLIDDVAESREDPRATWLDGLLAKRAAAKLLREHGDRRLRLVFAALSEVPDFEPAYLLWNALHPDVPAHCFLQIKREPVFRILGIRGSGRDLRVATEHGRKDPGYLREDFLLTPKPAGGYAARRA